MNFFCSEEISCGPISTLERLLDWEASSSQKYKTEKLENLKKKSGSSKLIVCHDMRNNYLDDKYFQGTNKSSDFSFYHWGLIETFIYFSHHLVTIPTESWINAAHENNVRILGTFITEWKEGEEICHRILNDASLLDKVVEKLVSITLHYNFDGWLINIENPIKNTPQLEQFLLKLNTSLKNASKKYQIIWYDSVIKSGELKWQNELNDLNEAFFKASDAMFINYTWKDENLEASKRKSAPRSDDVYVGVDVFGRGCHGNGGFHCNLAVEKIVNAGLNVALFAPGWLHECNEKSQFFANSQKFWSLLETYFQREKISHLPLITSFTHSCGDRFFLDGRLVSSKHGWSNFLLQSKLPVLDSRESGWCFDDAFYAGSSVFIKPGADLELFQLELSLHKGRTIIFEFAYKIETDCRFSIELKYNDENRLNFLNENLKNFEYEMNDGWKLRRVEFEVENEGGMKCELLRVRNLSQSTLKLGLIKLYESNGLNFSSEKMSLVEKQVKMLTLLNKHYLCVSLKWSQDESVKYYNVFVDEKVKLDGSEDVECKNGSIELKRYLGSTKKNEFKICFSLLHETIEFRPSFYGKCSSSTPSFNVYIQPIDYYLNNLGLKNLSNHFQISFQLSTLRVRDEKNLDFIDQVVHDFELFNFV